LSFSKPKEMFEIDLSLPKSAGMWLHSKLWLHLIVLSFLTFSLAGCTKDSVEGFGNGYPEGVRQIMRLQCATAGCHTSQSAAAAGGLNLETWDDLFKGSRGGSPVVPYSPALSYLLYAVNVDSSKGPVLQPTMPIGKPALSPLEYQTLRDWILQGARNSELEERFPPEPGRKKWYIANRECDLVAVLDAESHQIMRWIKVGTDDLWSEQPTKIMVSPDGKYWYAIFFRFNPHIEQYSTLTDEKVAEYWLGNRDWTNSIITEDGKFAFIIANNQRHVVVMDLATKQLIGPSYPLTRDLFGMALHPQKRQLYLPMLNRSGLYVIDFDSTGLLGAKRSIDLVQGNPGSGSELNPFEIVFSPDQSKYFISCPGSQELRIFSASNDSLLSVISVGAGPSHLAISAKTNRLYVSCFDDVSTYGADPRKRGSIYAIDMNQMQTVQTAYSGFQPYALAVDEGSNLLLVTNRNELSSGPSQHHPTPSCTGRSGNLSLLDLDNLQPVLPYTIELSVNPYSIAVKH
jgi:DNA-binding beta-propeller fold protein YncE